jgi:vacuolar-type H+-ATPase subunit E/Vma4
MSQHDSISPMVQDFIKDLTDYFDEEERPFAEAVQERLGRCTSDDEVERVAHGIVALLHESSTIIAAASDLMTVENIHLFPVSAGESEMVRIAAAIRSLS